MVMLVSIFHTGQSEPFFGQHNWLTKEFRDRLQLLPDRIGTLPASIQCNVWAMILKHLAANSYILLSHCSSLIS